MGPAEPLDIDAIHSAAGSAGRRVSLDILPEIDSTNAELLRRPRDGRHAVAVLAEQQAGGRGRQGRRWHSPPGRNVYLSLGWQFDVGRQDFAMLPLVVAVASARALKALGAPDVAIKWPNDLWLSGRKVGGCLVETAPGEAGARTAVIGVGLNVGMSGDPGAAEIDREWADLRDALPSVSRNQAAGTLLEKLVRAMEAFTAVGFTGFAEDWVRLDALRGQQVVVERESGPLSGRALGLGPGGGLLVEGPDGPVECLAGEVRVHAVGGRSL